MQPGDPELITRHEVLSSPPDVLVTNYSMLEYMLMRPLERPVFDRTREWLAANEGERLLLVIDEAHLYRGAAGAEVGLLLRRLRHRLGIPKERLQVICTSASFNDSEYAAEFAAELSGTDVMSFDTVTADLALRRGAATGSTTDADILANIPLTAFYQATTDVKRRAAVADLLEYRGVVPSPGSSFVTPSGSSPVTPSGSSDSSAVTPSDSSEALHQALRDFPPMSRLVNLTMETAKPLRELATDVFPDTDSRVADRALTTLVALGSSARERPGQPGLLPCRVHAFFRGLPGIWACLDPECSVRGELSASPVGQIWSQPRDTCPCGARVFELFTCRNCGTAYARAYTDDIESPSFLWSEPGGSFETAGGSVSELQALDLLLEPPASSQPAGSRSARHLIEPADLDLLTGRLNPERLGERVRGVFLRRNRLAGIPALGDEHNRTSADTNPREFRPCGVCGQTAAFGRTYVQDHQTKGDQPFQALIMQQLQTQPPSSPVATDFAPLQGRKVLIFSDSRQTAARLAPNLQVYSMRDALRPLILSGWRDLSGVPGITRRLSLDDIYLAILLASQQLGVRLRPELKGTESMHVSSRVTEALNRSVLADPMATFDLISKVGRENPPESLLRAIHETLTSKYFGLQSLALATVRETGEITSELETLPDLPGIDTPTMKVALCRLWLSHWSNPGYWFPSMPPSFWKTRQGVRPHSGNFKTMERWLTGRSAPRSNSASHGRSASRSRSAPRSSILPYFKKHWLPRLLEFFTEYMAPKRYRILAQRLALEIDGEWAHCRSCRTVQRPFPGDSRCVVCCQTGTVKQIDPDSDPVFAARKGYYRTSSIRALAPEDEREPPFAIMAAEHTAQLNETQVDEVFSRAEQHELLFQDMDIALPKPGEQPPTAIDVLSSTTTMEVGIDIGSLCGVALRNMPPARSSYQQRAGRAGRRGNAVATVLAFGSADSHDEQYFREPEAMIRGPVEDPTLTLDNVAIARRHVTAFLFQRYHEERLPDVKPYEQPQLFEVLGTVKGFLSNGERLNRRDFEAWLRRNEDELRSSVDSWLPEHLKKHEREDMLLQLVDETLRVVDKALVSNASEDGDSGATDANYGHRAETAGASIATKERLHAHEVDVPADEPTAEVPSEVDDEPSTAVQSATNLLDRLLYKGVLPPVRISNRCRIFSCFRSE